MAIRCLCVPRNIHSHLFLQNYKITQFALIMDRTAQSQVGGRPDPGMVHEPILSTVWCFLHGLMSQVAVWQPQGLPGKFSNLKPWNSPSMINCCACWESKLPTTEVTSKHWYGAIPRLKVGRDSSSLLVRVWLHWTTSIMGRTTICPIEGDIYPNAKFPSLCKILPSDSSYLNRTVYQV